MSIAPLSARPSRFLAVVASAVFILLVLGTGGQADDLRPTPLSPAISSRSLRNHLPHPPINSQLVELTGPNCNACIAAQTQRQCEQSTQICPLVFAVAPPRPPNVNVVNKRSVSA
jgi:hypothetical protein